MTTRKKPAKGAGKKTSAPAPADARLQAIFEGSRDAIGVSRAGIHVLVNPAYRALFGFPPDADLTGTPILDLISPERRDQIKDYVARRARGESVPAIYETRGLRTDGTEFDMEVSVSLYREGNEDLTLVILRNITDRKTAEREIDERGATLRQIMDTASVAIFLVNRSGRIIHANRRMAEMFGCAMQDLLGAEYVSLVHPSEREIGRQKMLALLASEIPSVDLERHYWRRDGTEFWGHLAGRRYHDVQGNELGLIGVITDIDKRKRVEEALKNNEGRLNTILDNVGAAIFIKDTKYRYTYVNRNVCKIFGKAPEEILGKGDDAFFSAASLADIMRSDRPVIERGETVAREEALIAYSDKVLRTYWTVKLSLRDSSGSIIGLCGISSDITDRKRAEQTLKYSEEKFRTAFYTSPDSIYINRLEDGMYVSINKGFSQITGYEEPDVIGKTPLERNIWVDPNDRKRLIEGLTANGEVRDLEARFRKKNGEIFYGLMSASVITIDGVLHALNVTRDITERKRAEASLKEGEEKYRRLYNETPVMLHSIDRDARVVEVNHHWLRTLGYDRDEVIGRKVTDFYTAASRKYALEVIQPAFFRNGIVNNVSYQFVKKNGDVVDVLLSATAERDADGNVVRSQAVIEDITDRKRAEEALRESEARYRALYEGTPVMMHSIDAEGRLVSVSDHWLKKLGYTKGEVLGRQSTDFLDEQSRTYARTKVLPDFMRTGICNDVPYTFIKKNGEGISTLLSAIAERNEAGKVVRSLAVIIDITERKKAEDALRKSEKMLQTIIDAEPECVKLLDQNANLIMMNRAGLDMIQVESLDEVKGQCICPMVTSEYRDAFMDLTRRVFQGESGTFLFEMIGMKGRRLWLETHAVPLRNEKDEITALLGVTRDVTERKRAEEEARRNEARMASLFRIAQQSMEDEQAFLNLALHEAISLTGSVIGYLYFYDEEKREFNLKSYSRDVMKECSIADRKTCYELDRTGIWGEAVRQRKPIILNDYEAEHPLKKGYPEGHVRLSKFLTIPVIMQGAVVAVVGVANKQADYTDADVVHLNFLMDSVWKMITRARAERALQESEERFRDLAQTLPLTIFELDLQGRLTYVNRAALDKFGYTQQHVEAGVNVMKVVAPQDRDRAGADMVRRISGGGPPTSEYLGLRKDGSTFPVMVASNPILQDGRPAGLRGIVMDLTERKQLEEERFKAQKLESIGTLAGGIAHDFNNLLQGIFGYISMAKMTIDQREKSLAMLEQAEKALHHSVNLTSQLLTFSKGGKPVKKATDLRTVIENSVKFALSGSRVSYELSFGEGLSSVDADEGQIGQVVQNIVLNAEQAMPLGGRIEIAARNVPPSHAAGLPLNAPDGLVEIVVRDHGTGIPPEHLPRIFDPYFTTKEKGSGLGLATSYSIIKNHDGMIDVSSELGKGAIFTIFLPASGQKAAADPGPASSSCLRTCRILVMDDEEIVRKVAYELLTGLGHDVEAAAHGDEAIAKYRQAIAEGRPFDVVILDLTIRGGMGGAEAMKRLREIDPGVKAIVSSGYSDDAVVANYREHGFAAFLKKPYDLTGLQATLNELLA